LKQEDFPQMGHFLEGCVVRWKIFSLLNLDARQQSSIGIALMSVIPLLVICLIFFYSETNSGNRILALSLSTIALGLSGYVILQKYPRNILELRNFILEIANGTIPEKINLLNTDESDDLRFIERGFNVILAELKKQIGIIENQLELEKKLRKQIEEQQEKLISAEKTRVMIQSLGAACHHIGQPTAILGMHLYLMKEHVGSEELRKEIDVCMGDLEIVGDILEKLKAITYYRTTPYIQSDDLKIIDIESSDFEKDFLSSLNSEHLFPKQES